MNPELVVAREAATLLRRDPAKYVRGVIGMYLLSLKGGIEIGSTFRSGYYFVRHVDDVLDGDRQVSSDPLAYVQDLRYQLESGNFKNGMTVSTLAQHAVVNLEKRIRPGDNPRADFLDAINAIVFDYLRSKNRRVLTTVELEDYYHRVFDPVVNLTLMIVGSSLRSIDVPVMSYGQGRVYSARDLRTDWQRGTINIPQETLTQADLTPTSPIDAVTRSLHIRRWFNSTLTKTKPELKELREHLRNSPEKLTFFICGGLINPMLKFIDNYQRSTDEL